MKTALLLILLTSLTSCYQVSADADDLRTVPITNNPNLLPESRQQPGTPSVKY